MGILGYFYSSGTKTEAVVVESKEEALPSVALVVPIDTKDSTPAEQTPSASATEEQSTQDETSETATKLEEQPATTVPPAQPVKKPRRLSLQSLGLGRKRPAEHKRALSTQEEHEKRDHVVEAAQRKAVKKEQMTKSEKRAKKNALLVRAMIVGPTAPAPTVTPAIAKPKLNKIKSQLLETKSANKLIAELRHLPASDGADAAHSNAPIHAVCLEHTDEEEQCLHFAKLGKDGEHTHEPNKPQATAGILTAPTDKLAEVFKEMRLVDLLKSPDLGIGQPGDGEGLLAGAVPTAGTVINGVRQITPELMALGYATGRAISPDHSGIYPPTDRMSVLTYWWGLEVLLPPPSLEFLSSVQSVTGSVMNFLSAAALVNNGIREILPFVRYIAQFIDFEFAAIKSQDKGEGVVCAATWLMPAALVPRPWDFPRPPGEPSPIPLPSEPPATDAPADESASGAAKGRLPGTPGLNIPISISEAAKPAAAS